MDIIVNPKTEIIITEEMKVKVIPAIERAKKKFTEEYFISKVTFPHTRNYNKVSICNSSECMFRIRFSEFESRENADNIICGVFERFVNGLNKFILSNSFDYVVIDKFEFDAEYGANSYKCASPLYDNNGNAYYRCEGNAVYYKFYYRIYTDKPSLLNNIEKGDK